MKHFLHRWTCTMNFLSRSNWLLETREEVVDDRIHALVSFSTLDCHYSLSFPISSVSSYTSSRRINWWNTYFSLNAGPEGGGRGQGCDHVRESKFIKQPENWTLRKFPIAIYNFLFLLNLFFFIIVIITKIIIKNDIVRKFFPFTLGPPSISARQVVSRWMWYGYAVCFSFGWRWVCVPVCLLPIPQQ